MTGDRPAARARTTPAIGAREAARLRTTATILAAARAQLAQHGAVGLSMRAVARDVDLVSSAVYRYFPTREALLTAMIIESYGHLAEALDEASKGHSTRTATGDSPAAGRRPAAQWRALARAFRAWGRAAPHEYQLIYGTPIPDYVAPPETVPAAAAVALPFLQVGAAHEVVAFTDPALTAQMAPFVEVAPDARPAGVAAVLAELAALVGFVSLELAGHFVGTADPADHLYDALITRQTHTLHLA